MIGHTASFLIKVLIAEKVTRYLKVVNYLDMGEGEAR